MIEIVAPRLASTVLLLRDGSSSDIEVFMMVRHHQIEFNSGALVFPGGSVDKNDKEIAANPALYSGGDGLDGDALVSGSLRSARRLKRAASCWRGRGGRRIWSMPGVRTRSRPRIVRR